MKSKFWIWLFAVLAVVCGALSLWLLLPGDNAAVVEVWSEGELLYTLPLDTDREVTVTTARGTNTVTVMGGKVAVTDADCPDGWCMKRGYCSSGAQIVCLPHRLVLKFTAQQEVDGIVG